MTIYTAVTYTPEYIQYGVLGLLDYFPGIWSYLPGELVEKVRMFRQRQQQQEQN
jgi:hypothetical protein